MAVEPFLVTDAAFEEQRRSGFWPAFGRAMCAALLSMLIFLAAVFFTLVRLPAKLCSVAIIPAIWFLHTGDLKIAFMFGVIFLVSCALLAGNAMFISRGEAYVRIR